MTTAPADGERFEFGKNWRQFLSVLDERRIRQAEQSLMDMLGRESLEGVSFCDVGSGSGVFSLAARRLGARVHSFDLDPSSVECTAELRRRYFPNDQEWRVEQGSAIDDRYLNELGQFDVVYSWGVLHHTGAMWKGMKLIANLVAPNGILFVALYNDQGWSSKMWRFVKHSYNLVPPFLRFVLMSAAFLRLWGPTMVRDLVNGHPLASWRRYSSVRGMSARHDLIDWVGGFPFEVARPDDVVRFYSDRGFRTLRVHESDGLGCNEFVFARMPAAT